MGNEPRTISRRRFLGIVGAAGASAALGDGVLRSMLNVAEADAATAVAVPRIPPALTALSGVSTPVVSLNGRWHFSNDPPASPWASSVDPSSWPLIAVPGEPAMQGQPVKQDVEYPYKTMIQVPASYRDRRILLRFDGTYSYARVWVDGQYVGDHHGGFTSWDADITPYVTPGRDAVLTVGITDQSSSIAGASAYAHHNIGGILRDVSLLALPHDHLTRLHTDTTFDAGYRDATLTVTAAAELPSGGPMHVMLALRDPDGRRVPLHPQAIDLTPADAEASVRIHVPAPAQWSAEHPHLYGLEVRFSTDTDSGSIVRSLGFRQVEAKGDELLLNGRPLHIRGVDHHSISPDLGRCTRPELDAEDIRLFKDANVNFIRTSHYPPPPALLDAADRLGMYIEEEAPVCFQYGTVDDPAYRDRYLSQFAEMIERDRDHASVIEWSLGNESGYGSNFAAENDYSHQVDTSRPTVFEDAGQRNGGSQADVYSGHYPGWNSALGNPGQPIQYGEYAHCPNYDVSTLRADPGVHNFWGESIAKFPPRFEASAGVVGGSIWAGVDDVFELPDALVGYGEWGLIDIWRRRKPEHWLTKKAYSPIRIADRPLPEPAPGAGQIEVPVTNWYDFTNLGELAISWRLGDAQGTLHGVDVPPQQAGTLRVPWPGGGDAVLRLEFRTRPHGELVDAFELPIGAPQHTTPPERDARPPVVTETATAIEVTGVDEPFRLRFDKATGQLTEASRAGEVILTGGPSLRLANVALGDWKAANVAVSTSATAALVTVDGSYGDVTVRFTLAIDGAGLLTTSCRVDDPPAAPGGGLFAAGIAFQLSGDADRLSWERDSLWSVYPPDHIGRAAGVARRTRSGPVDEYGVRPGWPWSEDMKDYYLFGKDSALHWTNDFRSTKESIRWATVTRESTGTGVRVESDGTQAVQVTATGPYIVDDADPAVSYHGSWTHAGPAAGYTAGDYDSTESFSNVAGDSATFAFQGTGVALIGAYNSNLGKIDVYVDGTLAADGLDLYGPSKNFQQRVFTKTGLAAGRHTISVVVTGDRNPLANNTYALVDGFEVTGAPGHPAPDTPILAINDQWNYPDIDWGNYVKPAISLQPGAVLSNRLRLIGGPESE